MLLICCDYWDKKMPTVNELMNIAKVKLANLLTSEVFMVRALFKGYEWNRTFRRERFTPWHIASQ